MTIRGGFFGSAFGRVPARLVAIYNSTPYDIPPYGIVSAVGGVQTPLGVARDWLDVDAPNGDGSDYLLVNTNKELTSSSPYGHGIPVGSGPLWIAYDNTGTPVAGEEWGPVDGSFLLSEEGDGFRILKVDATNEVVLAAPMQETPSIRFAKLNGDLATGGATSPSTATAEFYETDTNNPPQLVASGNTFTVVNYSTDFSGSTGDFIIVARIQGVWHIIAADC